VQIMGLLGMYFDAAVVRQEIFRLALAILWDNTFRSLVLLLRTKACEHVLGHVADVYFYIFI
jgi:hypothetical protein